MVESRNESRRRNSYIIILSLKLHDKWQATLKECERIAIDQAGKQLEDICLMHKRKMIADRRAESAVIANMILVAAVIAIGFAVLIYTNSKASIFAQEYYETVSSDI